MAIAFKKSASVECLGMWGTDDAVAAAADPRLRHFFG